MDVDWSFFKPLKLISPYLIENLNDYKLGGFHPVEIGNTFQNKRYTVVHKLGFGGFSTVWLGFDSQKEKLVALKIVDARHSLEEVDSSTDRDGLLGGSNNRNDGCTELDMIHHIAERVSKEGQRRLAVKIETFWISGVNGKHLVLVSDVHGPCLQDWMERKTYLPSFAQGIMLDAAKGLQDLHRAGIIHGDFTTRNILIRLDGFGNLKPEDVENYFDVPVKEKLKAKRGFHLGISAPTWVFKEADMCRIPREYVTNKVIIIDFGLAMSEKTRPPPFDNGSPYSYRAPEIMECAEAALYLGAAKDEPGRKFSDRVDIWALACDIFEVRTGKQLFRNGSNSHTALFSVRDTMAGIWLENVYDDWVYIGESWGSFKAEKTLLFRIENEPMSRKEKDMLYDLLKKMLQRKPSHRIGIDKVVEHPWFTTNFDP